MKIFGFEIARTKAPVAAVAPPSGWNYSFGLPFWSGSHGFPLVQEPFTGAWQKNMGMNPNTLLVFHAIYRCITLISQDISKLRIRLMEQDARSGIWSEVDRNSPYWPVLTKPNRYQNRIQFFEDWMGSKLQEGNTYALKGRDERGIVTALYILNPYRTRVRVATDGSVYYELQTDNLAQVEEDKVVVPASEIIHDRYKPLFHPLCGISPLIACALSGMLGLSIQSNSNQFFRNNAQPGGILTADNHIEDDTAAELKERWENSYSGNNRGRTAVLGDGLKYQSIAETAVNSQLIEQLGITEKNVCTAFGVPGYMVGVGDPPNYNNVEAFREQYYGQCLQNLIEAIEILMDEGLGLTAVKGKTYGTEFDLSALLRMDTATKGKVWGDLVKGSIASPNEARAEFDLPPVKGGESPMAQQQNFSLAALAKRDAKPDPFASDKPAAAAPAAGNDNQDNQDNQDGQGDTTTGDATDATREFATQVRRRLAVHRSARSG